MAEAKVRELIFSGVQPSGAQVHIGNYLGAMRRFVLLQKHFETMFCIVDLHALTSVTDPKLMDQYTISLAAAYLAIGLDPSRSILFRQSDLPEVTELAWYLACNFPLGLLERAHAFKDSKAKGEGINSGVMFYPVLMAADILLPRATKVPVGADQKQHLEMTREVAQKFNSQYGEVFPLPEPLIENDTGVIPGLDGRKMSKSYNNYIGLFESSKVVKEKIMRIVTDSKSVAEKKDPETCNVFKLYRLLATAEETSNLAERYRAGGLGYGHAKEELFGVTERLIEPLRARYEDLISRPAEIRAVLKSGADRARAKARETITSVRHAIGLGNYL